MWGLAGLATYFGVMDAITITQMDIPNLNAINLMISSSYGVV